jgi:glycosyltransferase involved in cell wall biosynthesis
MHEQSAISEPLPSQRSQPDSIASDAHTDYVLITPVRDEEDYIGAMIESIAGQTVPPKRWIIVDDGSRDRTAGIVTEYASRFPFMELITLPAREQRLAGGEGAIPYALKRIQLSHFSYLARFDADLVFPPDYIAHILERFQSDPKLGIAGGILDVEKRGSLIVEKEPEYHVRGALKMYRRECFMDIGCLTTQIGWDTIDEVLAWSKGWATRSFQDIHALHRRPTGDGIESHHIFSQRGRAEYLTWSHPLHILARSLRIAYVEQSILKPCWYLMGYLASLLRHESRTADPLFIQTRRAQQIARLLALLPFGLKTVVPIGLSHSEKGLPKYQAQNRLE